MRGYSIHATDGDIGVVDEFYFDDKTWTASYLVVETGSWLSGRSVLISPTAIVKVDPILEKVYLTLTKEQVEKSPDVYSHKTLARQHEGGYSVYFGWPYYLSSAVGWGINDYPTSRGEQNHSGSAELRRFEVTSTEEVNDPHLRSTKVVARYHIMSVNGEIGHVDDFLLDEHTWKIRYIVVDTRNWWPGKKVLLAQEWIIMASWAEMYVYVNLTREIIKSAPEFELGEPVTREYEARLFAHYKRSPYWEAEESRAGAKQK